MIPSDKQLFVGIDNGLDGGMVLIDSSNRIIEKIAMPIIKGKGSKREYDINEIVQILDRWHGAGRNTITMAVLEKAQAFRGQGVTSMFKTGMGYGIMQGILAALDISHIIVHPKTWQSVVFRGLPHKDTKQSSIIFAKRLSPGTDWRATERSRKAHDGLTDAFCMAYYAKQTFNLL